MAGWGRLDEASLTGGLAEQPLEQEGVGAAAGLLARESSTRMRPRAAVTPPAAEEGKLDCRVRDAALHQQEQATGDSGCHQ